MVFRGIRILVWFFSKEWHFSENFFPLHLGREVCWVERCFSIFGSFGLKKLLAFLRLPRRKPQGSSRWFFKDVLFVLWCSKIQFYGYLWDGPMQFCVLSRVGIHMLWIAYTYVYIYILCIYIMYIYILCIYIYYICTLFIICVDREFPLWRNRWDFLKTYETIDRKSFQRWEVPFDKQSPSPANKHLVMSPKNWRHIWTSYTPEV